MGRDLLQELRRLPRRFTPRNDIILTCHCEHSEAISLNGTRLRRHIVPRNDIILSCHCERSEAISLNGSGITLGTDKITTSFHSS